MGGIFLTTAAARVAAVAAAMFVAFAIPACSTPRDELDLATNESLYQPPSYHARVAADRSAFLAPVIDARDTVAVEEAAGPYPTRWMSDGLWYRPLPEMIYDCLHEAFELSAVFASLQEASPPAADTLIVQPSLVDARAGQEERVFGRRSLASIGIRIVVHGPAAADGSRPVLLDEQFDQTVGTDVSPQPQRVPVVFGRALNQAVSRIVSTIDQGSYARSGMPPVDGR